MRFRTRTSLAALALQALLVAAPVAAEEVERSGAPAPAEVPEERFHLRFQATTIWQGYPSFRAAYSGENSLPRQGQGRETVTGTLFLGARLWQGAEVYVNPEVAQGYGLASTYGIAGFPNGDASKAGTTWPRYYVARAFMRQTIGLGGESEVVENDLNQMAGHTPSHRLVFTGGKLSVGDIFSDNRFSHDARTQFMNWSLLEAGAFDFASDARQYTWGGAAELYVPGWAFRYGAFAMPNRYNPPNVQFRGVSSLQQVVEVERAYTLWQQPGTVRLLGYYTRANMARFSEVLASPLPINDALLASRRYGTPKTGVALSLDQSVTEAIGVFMRLSWNDGRAEDLSFTEIDRSIAMGVSVNGRGWGRPGDTVGVGGAVNAISQGHRRFLGAGGNGLILGDGALRYGHERIAEVYYDFATPVNRLNLAVNYQFVDNPGYNQDRGPVHVFGFRMHLRL